MPRDRDYAAEYRERVRKARKEGLSRAQARGHAKNEPSISQLRHRADNLVTVFVANPPRRVTLEVDYRTAQRAGRYISLADRLRKGRIGPSEFRRRTLRMKPIGDLKLLSDPRAVLALQAISDREDYIFESGRSRPRRSRRSR
jgi:hypothetical protein